MDAVGASGNPAHHHELAPGPDGWPDDRGVGRASALKVGMWVFLLSDAFTFAGFLITYAVMRAGTAVWWPQGEPAFGINFTAGLTFLLICSSVTMVMAVAAARDEKKGQLLLWLGLTILGGALFLVGQYNEYFGIGHPGLIAEGLRFGQSHRASTFFIITSFHGLHVLSGVIYLSVVWLKAAGGAFRGGRYDGVEVAGLFWHFIDLVWILVFTFVYLIPATPGAAS